MQPSQTSAHLTDAERDALAYMVRNGETEWYSSELSGLYAERYRAAQRADGREPYVTVRRAGAWNRISGSAMRRLERKGILAFALRDGYSTRYRLTDAGREALRS